MLKRIPGPRVTQQVQERVTAHMAAQKFETGDRLPSLGDLTRMLGVSRPSVREGLRALEALGIIEIRHGSGIFVASGLPPLSGQPALTANGRVARRLSEEMLAVRLAVEPEVAALAAVRATDRDLARLRRNIEEFGRDLDKMANPPSDVSFHFNLCRAAHNSGFTEIMKWISRFYVADAKLPEQRDVEDHARILDAVERRNAKAARAEMKRHLRWIGKVMKERPRHGGDRLPLAAVQDGEDDTGDVDQNG
ncbi:MAG: FadR/GntR family transcriptional regulator [Dongiaceae bacterium]